MPLFSFLLLLHINNSFFTIYLKQVQANTKHQGVIKQGADSSTSKVHVIARPRKEEEAINIALFLLFIFYLFDIFLTLEFLYDRVPRNPDFRRKEVLA